jgi:hypothetical protein
MIGSQEAVTFSRPFSDRALPQAAVNSIRQASTAVGRVIEEFKEFSLFEVGSKRPVNGRPSG